MEGGDSPRAMHAQFSNGSVSSAHPSNANAAAQRKRKSLKNKAHTQNAVTTSMPPAMQPPMFYQPSNSWGYNQQHLPQNMPPQSASYMPAFMPAATYPPPNSHMAGFYSPNAQLPVASNSAAPSHLTSNPNPAHFYPQHYPVQSTHHPASNYMQAPPTAPVPHVISPVSPSQQHEMNRNVAPPKHESHLKNSPSSPQHSETTNPPLKAPVLRPVRNHSLDESSATHSDLNDSVATVVTPRSHKPQQRHATPVSASSRRYRSQQSSSVTLQQISSIREVSSSLDEDPEETQQNQMSEAAASSPVAPAAPPAASQAPTPDVYELLRVQEEQLNELRAQLSRFLSKQEQQRDEQMMTSFESSTATAQVPSVRRSQDAATQMSNHSTPVKRKPEHSVSRRSAGVNTSMLSDAASTSMEQSNALTSSACQFDATGQTTVLQPPKSTSPPIRLIPAQGLHQPTADPRTPDPSRGHAIVSGGFHPTASQGSPSFSSATPGRRATGGAGAMSSSDTMSMDNFLSLQTQDATQESIMSEMLVDIPAYTSLSPDK